MYILAVVTRPFYISHTFYLSTTTSYFYYIALFLMNDEGPQKSCGPKMQKIINYETFERNKEIILIF